MAWKRFGAGQARFVGPIVKSRPDETFYSWIARISAYLGGLPRETVGRLFFGGDQPAFYADLPVGLARFVGSSGQVDGSVLDLAIRMSGYGYYASFLESAARAQLLAAMSDIGTYPPSQLGISSDMVSVQRLRFCPECHRLMDDRFPDRWWRRTHQLPTTIICPDHRVGLAESLVDSAAIKRAFHLPSAENCPSRPDPLDGVNRDARERLLLLSQMGRHYLDHISDLAPRQWAEDYIARCSRLGIATGTPQAAVAPVHSELGFFWRDIPGRHLRCANFAEQSWVHSLLIGNKRASPVNHLLLQGMLAWQGLDTERFEQVRWLAAEKL